MTGNGKKRLLKPSQPSPRDLRLASAIGQAVQESIGPKLDAVTTRLDDLGTRLDAVGTEIRELRTDHGKKLDDHGKKLDDHGRKLDQLISGAVGVGRIVALEQRVMELERQR